MQIRVICPRCERVFQVDSDLVGRKLLCPNRMCGEIFEVQPAPDSPQPPLPEAVDVVPMAGEGSRSDAPTGSTAQSGSVGDMVPMLPAEGVPVPMAEPVGPTNQSVPTFTAELDETPASESEPKTADWRQAPPPLGPSQPSAAPAKTNDQGVSRAKRAPKRKRMAPDTVKLTPPSPTELPAGSWEPPPVRGGPVADGQTTEVAPEEPSRTEAAPPTAEDDLEKQFAEAARRRRRRRLVLGGALLAGIAAVIAALVIFLPGWLGTGEAERARLAQADYDDGRFTEAFNKFTDLVQKYPDSEQHADYEFMAGLSDVRQHLPNVNADIPGASDALRQLVVGHEKDEHIAQHAQDIWAATQRIISHYTQAAKTTLADKHADLNQVKQNLEQAKNWLATSDRYPPQAVPGSARQRLEGDLKTQETGLAKAEARRADLAQASNAQQFPADAAGLKKLDAWLREKGYAEDEDFQAAYHSLQQHVLRAVQYVELRKPPARQLPGEDPGLVVGLAPGKASPGDAVGVTFAVARGVLYALRADDLSLLWFTRVGHDTTRPPVRLPRDSLGHQAVLVLSSDQNTLTARDMHTGHALWSQLLGDQPCVAWPLVIDRLAYVPTVDGIVHVIETNEGYEIGQYKLGGMELDLGGVQKPGTDLVYFAANRDNIYVLNVKTHVCAGILSTNHGPKTLEGPPVFISRATARAALGIPEQEQEKLPDYLVLTVQAGGATKMRVFRLSAEPGQAAEEGVDVSIPGFASFPPYSDLEKMVQVTDAGSAVEVAVLGIGQPGNSDPPLFVQSINNVQREGTRRQAARSQVVYAREDDFWILANGELQRWHYDVFRQKLSPVWSSPLSLGEPLHAAEPDFDGQVLSVITQAVPQETCLITAIAATSGKVVNRRQIGFMSQGEPLVLSNGEVVALDRGGSFFVIKPTTKMQPGGSQTIGRMLGGPVAVNGTSSFLLPAPDGHSVVQVTAVDRGTKRAANRYELLIRRYTPGQLLVEKRFNLGSSRLAGTPAVESNSVIVPLAGDTALGPVLRRCSMADGSSSDGPSWSMSPKGVSYVLSLGDGDLLFTDGGAQLKHASWQPNDFHVSQTIDMPAQIVAPPLLLPSDPKHPGPRILVTDADKNVVLFEGTMLTKKHPWKLKPGEQITAGPYLSGGYLVCVMDKRTLVWLNLADNKLRSYQPQEADVEIVGRPQVIGDKFVVADTSPQFLAIEAATGKVAREAAYAPQDNITPMASPVTFGAQHVMDPLMDGTVLVLPLARLQAHAK